MAKPKAATFPRLRRKYIQPNKPHVTTSSSDIPEQSSNTIHDVGPERVTSSHIMLGVVAVLDIRTDDGDDVSKDFEDALLAMGAKVRKTFTDNITHLVFKNGATSALQKAYAKSIPVVNLLWITRSQTIGCKLDEKQFTIERPPNLSVGTRRRRKSMEPGRVKELILDPRRFSSSWLEAHPAVSQQQHSVNTKGLARLSLDDDSLMDQPSAASTRPKRPTLGPIRQSALKFIKDLQRESGTSDLNKDVPLQVDSNEERVVTGAIPQASSDIQKTARLQHDNHFDPTAKNIHQAPRIALPRSTVHSELQISASGLCFAVKSRLASNRRPVRSTSSSAVMITNPSTKPDIKSNFYFATDSSIKPPIQGSQQQAAPLKRKRRSSSVGPRLSLQGDERTRLPFWASDVCMQTSKQRKTERRTIILTSMDQQSRSMCSEIVEKLGVYEIGVDIDDSTTHIIVGCKRRTMSVAFGILRGLWLVTVDWIKASAETGSYVPEQDFEITNWYPKCAHTRRLAEKSSETLPGAKLLISRKIYVGQTMFDSKLITKLTEECGASLCENVESATLVIATEAHDNIPTVIENWLFDCIEQFEDLPIDSYTVPL